MNAANQHNENESLVVTWTEKFMNRIGGPVIAGFILLAGQQMCAGSQKLSAHDVAIGDLGKHHEEVSKRLDAVDKQLSAIELSVAELPTKAEVEKLVDDRLAPISAKLDLILRYTAPQHVPMGLDPRH